MKNKLPKPGLTGLLLLLLFSFSGIAQQAKQKVVQVEIKTTAGNIIVKLYNETPLHKANFIKLVNEEFYNDLIFHRVINKFMIQGGDPKSKNADPSAQLGGGGPGYTIPAEINPKYFHKKGALAAARLGNEINPEMRSSGTQFYIVQGKKQTEAEVTATGERINSSMKQALFSKLIREVTDSARLAGTPLEDSEIQRRASMKMFDYLTTVGEFKFPREQIDSYMNAGGVPRLDGTYTVFGEVIEGIELVDRIAAAQTNAADKPVNDIKIVKMKLVSK